MPKKLPDLKPKAVLGVAAHPDDLDFGMSGSAAKWAAEGTDVYYLLLTDGSKGSDDRHISSSDLTKLRRREQQAAAKILGLKDVFFLDYEDGLLLNDANVKRDIARVIRQTKPEVVVTMDPKISYWVDGGYINHPDHRAAGQATLDAVFPLARDHLSFPELLAAGLEPHKVPTVLLMSFGQDNNFTVDITDTLNQKLDALAAHASQMSNIEETHLLVRDWAKQAGRLAGYDYAESFLRIDIQG
jgi:LmbE family N-acetylglucosaminyl deacetylase